MVQDWRSKVIDTLVTAGGLVLVSFVLLMAFPVVERLYGKNGLLIFAFVMIALTIFCLERATVLRLPETWRARSGTLSGLAAWSAVELAIAFGGLPVSGESWLILLTLAILLIVTLWRRVLGIGVQFFSLTFLFGWIGHTILIFFARLQNGWLAGYDVFWWTALIFGLLALAITAWTMFRSRTRLQRLMLAVMLWFCLLMVLYSVRGGSI